MPPKPKGEVSVRTSVTLPSDLHASLELIAKQKKVSTAWVIRDAAEKYIAEQWPLFAGAKHE
jgi:metal-responsive CopG/Arc/MetJ family transcriptional regulator